MRPRASTAEFPFRGTLTVFFDGDPPERMLPPRGVHVRYSAPLSSDQAILDAAARRPAELAVVTNDRTLRARCRDAGARVMGWGEFSARLARRLAQSPGEPQKEKAVDVAEWSKFFGLDPDRLQ